MNWMPQIHSKNISIFLLFRGIRWMNNKTFDSTPKSYSPLIFFYAHVFISNQVFSYPLCDEDRRYILYHLLETGSKRRRKIISKSMYEGAFTDDVSSYQIDKIIIEILSTKALICLFGKGMARVHSDKQA